MVSGDQNKDLPVGAHCTITLVTDARLVKKL